MRDKKRSQITPRRRRKAVRLRPRSKPQPIANKEDAIQAKDIEISTSSSPLSNEFIFPDRQRIESHHDSAGDAQGLSDEEVADSESVAELIDEGQALEADIVEGVEDAPDPDQSEVRIHSTPAKRGPRNFKDRRRI